jgi:hypothetical protein
MTSQPEWSPPWSNRAEGAETRNLLGVGRRRPPVSVDESVLEADADVATQGATAQVARA